MIRASFLYAVELLLSSHFTVAITGAGISTESGIPSFRGADGLWKRYHPEEYATIDALKRNPEKCWQLFLDLYQAVHRARPNETHRNLALLEKNGYIHSLLTQNIDGLHQASGQQVVIELHGNLRALRCMECTRIISSMGFQIDTADLPPRCVCGGNLRPDIVLFGESIPSEKYLASLQSLQKCSLLLLIGTSGLVHPVASMPELAINRGIPVIEINSEKTVLTDMYQTLLLRDRASVVLTSIIHSIRSIDPGFEDAEVNY